MTDWKCTLCGYQLKADAPPAECPACKARCEFVDNTCYTPDGVKTGGVDHRIK